MMKRLLAVAGAVAVTISWVGCDSHVLRRANLTFENGLPQALTSVNGSSLHLSISRLEHLETGYHLKAWASTPGGATAWVELGEVEPGEEATFDAQALGFSWADVMEVVISEEVEGAASAEPSATVYFRGEPGGALPFGGHDGPTAESFHEATASMRIEDEMLEVTHAGLPALGAGLHYGVWLLKEAGQHAEPTGGAPADEGHSHKLTSDGGMHMEELDGGMHTEAEGHGDDHVDAGHLDMEGHHMFQGHEMLASFHEVVITVEMDHGHDEPSLESVVMRAAIPHGVVAGASGGSPPAQEGHSH